MYIHAFMCSAPTAPSTVLWYVAISIAYMWHCPCCELVYGVGVIMLKLFAIERFLFTIFGHKMLGVMGCSN